jgi:hypothetical protein
LVKRLIKSRIMPWISLAIGLILSAFILMIVIFRTDFFANNSSRMFSRYLFEGTRFSLSVGRLSGNPLGKMKASDFRIRYNGDDFSFDVVRVEEIRFDYSLGSLLSEFPRIRKVEIDRAHVWIKPDSSGINIIPHTREGGSGALPVFGVDRIVLSDGQVIYQGSERADAFRGINIEGMLRSNGDDVELILTEGSAEDLRRDLRFRQARGKVRYIHRDLRRDEQVEIAGSVLLDDLYLKLEESSVSLTGRINPDSLSFDLDVEANPLNIEEIARAVEVETDHYGELQGPLHINGLPDSFRLNGTLNGIFSGYAFDNFAIEGSWSPPVFSIASGSGKINGSPIVMNGYYRTGDSPVGHIETRAEHLDLSAGFHQGRNLPRTDFNGDIKLTYYFASGELFYELDLDSGHIREFPYDKAFIDGSYCSDSLVFDRIYLESPTHRISSHGVLGEANSIRMFLEVECAREDSLFPYLGIEQYRADMKMNGVLAGTFDRWELRGNGTGGSIDYGGIFVPHGETKLVVRNWDGYEVFFDLTGDSCVIDPFHFSGIDFSLEYRHGTAGVKKLYLYRPDFSAETRGEVNVKNGRVEIVVGEMLVDVLDETWRGSGNFSVIMDERSIAFDDLQLHSKLGALYMNCVLDKKDETIDGFFEFDRLDLSLINAAGLMEKRASGRMKGSIRANGKMDDPDLEIRLDLSESLIDTIPIDTLNLEAKYSSRRYSIDRFQLSSPMGEMELGGRIEGAGPIELYDEWEEALPGYVIDIDASCRQLSLAPFLGFSGNIPFDNGSFTGTVELYDELIHPSAKMKGSIEDLTRPNLVIPLFEFEAELGSEAVLLDGRIGINEKYSGEFTGRVPLQRERWFYSIHDEGEILMEINIPPSDLDGLTEVTDLVAEAKGRFSAGLKIGGPIHNPGILGDLTLENANFRLSGMEELYRNVGAHIQLQDTLITVSRLQGSEGKEGKFECEGSVGLHEWRPVRYDLDLKLEKILIASIPDVMAIVTGDIHIGTETYNEKKIPSVVGELEVNRAEVFFELEDYGTPGAIGSFAPPSWLARVDMDVPGNTWIKTPDASIEMQGEVTMYHDRKGTYLRGSLDLVRGWYNLYGNKFRVRSGELEFVKAGSVRPVIDIEAETRDPEGRNIFLTLVWREDDVEPRVTLTHEDPGYSETDIWKMLGGGYAQSPDGEVETWDALGTAQGIAANYLERVLNSQMEGITIEVEQTGTYSNSTEQKESSATMIAVGKYLSEGLYVKYKQGLSIYSERHIEVEYRISRLLLLKSELITYSERVLQGKSRRSTDEYNVDLQLRWEF